MSLAGVCLKTVASAERGGRISRIHLTSLCSAHTHFLLTHTFCLILGGSAARQLIIEKEVKINPCHQLLTAQQFVPVYVPYDSKAWAVALSLGLM